MLANFVGALRMRSLRFAAALLLSLTLSASPSAALTVYYMGAEDLDFNGVGSVGTTTTTTFYRSAYARGALSVTEATFGVANQSFYTTGNRFSLTSFWVSARVYPVTGAVPFNINSDVLSLADANGNKRLALTCVTSSSGICAVGWRLQKIDTAGTHTALVTLAGGPPLAASTKIDIQVISYGVSGTVNVYMNGALVGGYTGDLTTNGNSALNGLVLSNLGSQTTAYWSEVFVIDQDSRSLGLATLPPAGTGVSNDFTCTGASPAASVNSFVNTDATNCSAASAALTQLWSFSSLNGAIAGVQAVGLSQRSASGASGPQNLAPAIRTGGTTTIGSNALQSISLLNYQTYYPTKPGGGNWSLADVNALQGGTQSAN